MDWIDNYFDAVNRHRPDDTTWMLMLITEQLGWISDFVESWRKDLLHPFLSYLEGERHLMDAEGGALLAP